MNSVDGHVMTTCATTVAPNRGATKTGQPSPTGQLWQRVRSGDLGSLPVVVGLVIVWGLFQALNSNFLTPRNLSNLVLQIAVLGTLAIGLVMTLVLGEIDLSVGAIAGVCAGTMAVLLTNDGWPVWAALGLTLAMGAAIGGVQGTLIVSLGIPSFIITLAGLLVWQGVQLVVVGDAGEIPITNGFVRAISSTYLSPGVGWGVAVVVVVAYAATQLSARRARERRGLRVLPVASTWLRIATVAVSAAVSVAVLNAYFGVPWVLVVLLVLTLAVGGLLTLTPLGRHLYAIGGNREEARRAGVHVRSSTVTVFVVVSALSALAGIIEASRQFSVSNALGGGTLQLDAIAAVVIGGTSLFGGRGRAYHALLGALVVGSVENGLDLLGQTSAVKNVATGLILVLAVSIDALGRRRRLSTGAGA